MEYGKKEDKHSLADKVGAFVVMLLAIVPLMLLEGYVLSKLWMWFIVPVFALPVLSVGQAVGIMVVVSMVTTHLYTSDSKTEGSLTAKMVEKLFSSAFMRLTVWGIGYTVYCCIY